MTFLLCFLAWFHAIAAKHVFAKEVVHHFPTNSQLGFINEGKTMVVGIDVTHPSPGSGFSAPSVAAMVASADENLAQWPAEIRVNPARQEKVDTLSSMLQEHLMYWYSKHEEYPEKLLIYRDGVSEGQYRMVLDEELPQLRAACEAVYEEKKPPCITLIVVGKRHHTRFYRTDRPTKAVLKDKEGNPSYGTVSFFPCMSTLPTEIRSPGFLNSFAALKLDHPPSPPLTPFQPVSPLRAFFVNLYPRSILNPNPGCQYRNCRYEPELGLLPTVTHGPCRDCPPGTLLCPLGRNLQQREASSTLPERLRLPLQHNLQHVLSFLSSDNVRQHPSARLLRRHCM